MKWLGAILIVGAWGSSGWIYAERFSQKIKELESWRQALHWCEMEINYNLLPLAEVLELIAERLNNKVGDMFKACAYGITNEHLSAQQSWQKALAVYLSDSPIGKENGLLLLRFGKSLGNSDLSQQNNNIHYACANLDQALLKAVQEKEAMAKIYRYLGIFAGLAAVLILY